MVGVLGKRSKHCRTGSGVYNVAGCMIIDADAPCVLSVNHFATPVVLWCGEECPTYLNEVAKMIVSNLHMTYAAIIAPPCP